MTAYALFGAALGCMFGSSIGIVVFTTRWFSGKKSEALAMTDLHRVSTTLSLAGIRHGELQCAGYKVIAHIIPAATTAAGIALLRKRGVKVSQPRPNLLLVAA